MKIIERETYLSRLISTIKSKDIKVITGVRRSGKSKLMFLFIKYLKKLKNTNIIHIDFNDSDFDALRNRHDFEKYVKEHYKKNSNNFLLVDEIEFCINFEQAINSLHSSEKYHIYLTGSNAFLLSSDLATLFTGRAFEIEVFPFSFNEYKKIYKLDNNYPAFDNYIKLGGMSGSYDYDSINDKYKYLSNVFNTSILRDIVQKYHIKNKILLSKIATYLADNVSNIISYRNIAKTLSSNNDKLNHKTIRSYLEYLCNAFLFYPVKRYDIKGKKYLSSSDKYYLCDHSFKYALTGTKSIDTGRMLENIVAIELLRRGYELYAGVLYDTEIDFVAIKNGEKLYIQVSDDITNENTFNREVNSLLKIKDAYHKMLIARTRSEVYQYEGIEIIDIADWLSHFPKMKNF